jgi:hypothetical protein
MSSGEGGHYGGNQNEEYISKEGGSCKSTGEEARS